MTGQRWQKVETNDCFNSEASLRQWLEAQATEHGLPYLLAHADDGVIWGRVDAGRLRLAGEVFPDMAVRLRPVTLQQARLFGPAGEVLVWRDDTGFAARLIKDGSDSPPEALPNETHYLWGEAVRSQQGFTLMQEGEQGLFHAPPLMIPTGKRAALKVRHYLDHDDQGQAHVTLSRLVDLSRV